MSLMGYTSGGCPVFFGPTRQRTKKTKGEKNKRFACKTCTARTTKNQAKKNGGVCFSCKGELKGFEQ